MKCLLKGMFGAAFLLIGVAIIYPQYGDYRAAAETSDWRAKTTETKEFISRKAIAAKSLHHSGIGAPPPKFGSVHAPSYVHVSNDGIIILQGGREEQMIALVPSLNNDRVSWTCVGSSKKATLGCKHEP